MAAGRVISTLRHDDIDPHGEAIIRCFGGEQSETGQMGATAPPPAAPSSQPAPHQGSPVTNVPQKRGLT
jgi:hypothetical protein